MILDLCNLDIAGRWAGIYTYPYGQGHTKRTDGESDFTVIPSYEPGANGGVLKISGEGHDLVGPFQFWGKIHSDAKLDFIKKYSQTLWWKYEGHYSPELKSMHGIWGSNQAGGGGLFAFHLVGSAIAEVQGSLQAMTGNWSGTHTIATTSKTVEDNFSLSGTVRGGTWAEQLKLQGHSNRSTQKYSIQGLVSPSGRVIFAKIFDQYATIYRGNLQGDENNTLRGYWQGNGMNGAFSFGRNFGPT
ncbi:hypothetical protein V8C35DRAFT_329697 [Trichoderma chlorosporum]